MTTIQFVVLCVVIWINVLVSPIIVYIWSYMAVRGKFDGVRDSKMKLTIKNVLNFKKYGKEN